MYSFIYERRVRYYECDPMGVVYHAYYVNYFEEARTEGFRLLGLPYKEIEDAGIQMPVVDLSVEYKRSAHYDDVLQIRTTVPAVPGARFNVDYEVCRAGETEILTTGHVTLCFLDVKRGRPVAAPERIRTLFERVSTETDHASSLPE